MHIIDHRSVKLACLVSALLLTAACATTSRFHPMHVPDNSLRLAQAMRVAPGSAMTVPAERPIYDILTASGLSDEQIRSGSIAAARVYCCGGPNEKGESILFFIPAEIKVETGDIVQVRVGRSPSGKESGSINMATQVVQKKGTENGQCWWDPPQQGLWRRVLFCNGLKEDGWVKQTGLHDVWYKPAP